MDVDLDQGVVARGDALDCWLLRIKKEKERKKGTEKGNGLVIYFSSLICGNW
jgi:hypothetical protein